jgi:tyrosyl-tRNA synthetase
MTILDELRWRGMLADCTDLDALTQRIAQGPITLYAGFDPTADSLHVGNLVPLFALRRFQMHGHHPIALAGGSTGMIGDPSGKSEERNLLTPEQLARNLEGIRPQLAKFLDFEVKSNPARLVNNVDWTAPVGVLDFLRDVGKHISVNAMAAKDSVRTRIETRETGISYAEFSYMLLQGFDFYHLRKTCDCELQVGATDQWGNITVGTELTRKKLGATVWGLVFPLLTKSDGTKYGKTAEGAVWLDPKRTSRYRFYQFFVNADDADVGTLLRALTFLPRPEIEALEAAQQANPGARPAQESAGARADPAGPRRRGPRCRDPGERDPVRRLARRHERGGLPGSRGGSPDPRARDREARHTRCGDLRCAGSGRPRLLEGPGAPGHRRRRRLSEQRTGGRRGPQRHEQ